MFGNDYKDTTQINNVEVCKKISLKASLSYVGRTRMQKECYDQGHSFPDIWIWAKGIKSSPTFKA